MACILSKELRNSEASVQYLIGKSTIRYWLKKVKEKSDCVTFPNTGIPKPMANLKLPKGVTYLQALTAVNAKAFLSESDFGQFCCKHGYLASTVDAWAELFSKHPERWISGTVLNCTPIGRVWLNPENGQLEEKRLPGTA